ncbi:hypothetical protein CBFG_02425 [Clostridiales bacterium 1_7_47FAA]|nr:hypothetical protein CBFG_02425 [Clostridiales bacterium 1_7_47FAA]
MGFKARYGFNLDRPYRIIKMYCFGFIVAYLPDGCKRSEFQLRQPVKCVNISIINVNII